MSLIRLLDVSGMFWPIWRAKEAAGKPVGDAASETVQALREHAARGGADHVVACCDSPGRTFRHDIAEEYKALAPDYRGYKGHRPDKDAAMMVCLERVIAELDQDGVAVLRAPGFEADDVIATVTAWAKGQGHDVEIVSEDKDLLSLVVDPDPNNDGAPSVCVIRRDGTRQGADECIARLGVPPPLVPAFLAMNGDKSDGILGIPGVGGTWAVRLLWGRFDDAKQWRPTPFKRFADVVDAAVTDQNAVEQSERERAEARANKVRPLPAEYKPKFPENVRKSLIANAASFDIGLRLATLRTDVPIDFAQVTAPAVPKPRTTNEWKEQRQKAANINAQIESEPDDGPEEEEDPMSDETPTNDFATAPVVIQPPAPIPPPPAAPQVVQATAPSNAPAAPPATTALALPKPKRVARSYEMELEPRSYEEAMLVAEHAADSGLFKDIRTPAQAIMLFQLGRKFGLSAVDSLRMIHMIEGKPSMSAQLIVGIVQKSQLPEFFEIEELENTHATWVTKRRGARRDVRWTFTVEDAKSAKLGGFGTKDAPPNGFKPDSNWAKHPKAMCMWRAGVFLARAVYTDLVGGLYTPDEISDVEMEIDGNPPTFGGLVAA